MPPTRAGAGRSRWRGALAPLGAVGLTLLLAAVAVLLADTLTSGPGAAQPPPGAGAEAAFVETVPAEVTDEGGPPDERPSPRTGAGNSGDPAPGSTGRVRPQWRDEVAEQTGIPARALEGYATAQLLVSEEEPHCQVSWPTLAGIGWVESQHGTYGGAEIGPDGTTTVDIIGIPLDGGPGLAEIPDTDDGELDGDPVWDRAVGPMQFIPQTWHQWGSSVDGGTPDPHHIDDAAYTAARYLCADGRDLSTSADWWEAILAYNNSDSYAREVLTTANDYAAAVRG
ncbi:transglycosylase SLT domain-containing protein [Lipingzhangella sp. LS1_29]|uniref:Transglycosylase SLT domain-containing protein n=1 Tax=Lipingzhangella rawalii TaxID=2055835 RepID=A0ABU2H3V6_9ACTN|nr:transglycosylase SLT domain-containing protein [Lipingzhangella rawalii]